VSDPSQHDNETASLIRGEFLQELSDSQLGFRSIMLLAFVCCFVIVCINNAVGCDGNSEQY
jgi:hypothetical protein